VRALRRARFGWVGSCGCIPRGRHARRPQTAVLGVAPIALAGSLRAAGPAMESRCSCGHGGTEQPRGCELVRESRFSSGPTRSVLPILGRRSARCSTTPITSSLGRLDGVGPAFGCRSTAGSRVAHASTGSECRGDRCRARDDRPLGLALDCAQRRAIVLRDDADPDRREAAWFEDVLVFGFFGGCATFVWFPSRRCRLSALSDVRGGVRSILARAWRVSLQSAQGSDGRECSAGCWSRGYRVRDDLREHPHDSVTDATGRETAAYSSSTSHQGIGDYWSASIVTVESSDSVVVRR